jgi:Tfp pilus assembly protein PilF
MTCPACGTPAHPDDLYCGRCGRRLQASVREEPLAATQKAMSLSDVRFRLGMVYYRKGDLPRAIETWRKALEAAPEAPDLRTWIERAEQELNGKTP